MPTGQTVRVPLSDGRALDGYLALPAATPAAAVLVVHEIYGLNDQIRDVTGRLAEAGYVALAVNLFSGAPRAVCMARLLTAMARRSTESGPVRDLRASLDWLRGRDEVGAADTGTIGFCMGGTFALALACTDSDLKAASVFYGQNPRPLSALQRACPIVGSYPGDDRLTRGGAVRLEEALAAAEVPHDVKVYEGARHSFFNDRGRAYHSLAAADSWARTLAFFESHLGPRPAGDDVGATPAAP